MRRTGRLHAREADIAPHRVRYRQRGWDQWRGDRFERQRQSGLVPAGWTLGPAPAGVYAWAEEELKEWQAERMAVYAAQVASIDRSTGANFGRDPRTGRVGQHACTFHVRQRRGSGWRHETDERRVWVRRGWSGWRLDGAKMRVGSGPDNLPGPPDTFAAYGLAWATTSNTPLRGTKLTGYEGGIRAPLIAWWPAGIAARGKIVNDVGHFIDVMPTFLELSEAKYPAALDDRRPLPLDGRSLVPVFRGEPLGPRESLAWRVPQHRVFRSGDWKIVGKGGQGAVGTLQPGYGWNGDDRRGQAES